MLVPFGNSVTFWGGLVQIIAAAAGSKFALCCRANGPDLLYAQAVRQRNVVCGVLVGLLCVCVVLEGLGIFGNSVAPFRTLNTISIISTGTSAILHFNVALQVCMHALSLACDS